MKEYLAKNEDLNNVYEDSLDLHQDEISLLYKSNHYSILYTKEVVDKNKELLTYDKVDGKGVSVILSFHDADNCVSRVPENLYKSESNIMVEPDQSKFYPESRNCIKEAPEELEMSEDDESKKNLPNKMSNVKAKQNEIFECDMDDSKSMSQKEKYAADEVSDTGNNKDKKFEIQSSSDNSLDDNENDALGGASICPQERNDQSATPCIGIEIATSQIIKRSESPYKNPDPSGSNVLVDLVKPEQTHRHLVKLQLACLICVHSNNNA